MLAVYGVDWRTLDSARFFALALRLPAFDGVIRVRVAAEADADAHGGSEAAVLADLRSDGWVD